MNRAITKEHQANLVLVKQARVTRTYAEHVETDIWRRAAIRAARQEANNEAWYSKRR